MLLLASHQCRAFSISGAAVSAKPVNLSPEFWAPQAIPEPAPEASAAALPEGFNSCLWDPECAIPECILDEEEDCLPQSMRLEVSDPAHDLPEDTRNMLIFSEEMALLGEPTPVTAVAAPWLDPCWDDDECDTFAKS